MHARSWIHPVMSRLLILIFINHNHYETWGMRGLLQKEHLWLEASFHKDIKFWLMSGLKKCWRVGDYWDPLSLWSCAPLSALHVLFPDRAILELIKNKPFTALSPTQRHHRIFLPFFFCLSPFLFPFFNSLRSSLSEVLVLKETPETLQGDPSPLYGEEPSPRFDVSIPGIILLLGWRQASIIPFDKTIRDNTYTGDTWYTIRESI